MAPQGYPAAPGGDPLPGVAVAAVMEASTHTVGFTASASLDIEPSPLDVEIEVYGGHDPWTEELVEAAIAASRILQNLGIEAIVVPSTAFSIYPGPRLYINGHEVELEKPSPEEIARKALELLGMKPREPSPLPASAGKPSVEAAATAW